MNQQASETFDKSRCGSCGMRFSYYNLFVNLGLAILKGFIGFLSGSRALQANSLYSINDVLSAIIVMVSLKIGGQPPDEDHVYGHGKAEFIAIAVISFIIVAGLFFIVYYSLIDIIRGVTGPPHIMALFVAALSMVSTELLARMGFCAARHKNDSPALHTSAEHNRADASSSLLVVIGIGGAILGLHILDPIVAIIETIHISLISGTFFGKAIKGLMDSSLPEYEIERIFRICNQIPGVTRVAHVRTRNMGTKSCVDIGVKVFNDISVERADRIADDVKATIRKALGRAVETNVRFMAEEMQKTREPDKGTV